MSELTSKIEKVLIRIFLIVAIMMFTYLVAFSIVFSYENIIFRYQEVFRVNDNILLNIFCVVFLTVLVIAFSKAISKIKVVDFKYIALGIGVLSSIIGIIWIYMCGSTPGADAGSVSRIASEANAGDFSAFGKGQYIGINHQQLGIVSVIRVMYLIFGDMNYNSFRILNAISIILLTYSGYKLTSILSNKNRVAEAIYCVLFFLCLPMYFYVPHVYGEMVSTALIVFSFWMIMELVNNFSFGKVILLFIAVFMALMFRQNTLIAVIAMVGVLLAKFLLTRRRSLIVVISIIIISCIGQNILMKAVYDKHMSEDTKSLPAICYICMGLNEDNNMAGWWNSESYNMYDECNHNPDAVKVMAKDLIRERMRHFISNPKQLIHFYIKKVSSQWIAPMWQSIAMSNVIDGSESKLADLIYYDEDVTYVINRFTDAYQIVIYLCCLLWLISCYKNPEYLENYLIPITAFGGMLFSILWEAKTRYMFPYYLMIIVIAAVGMGRFVKKDEL